MLHLINSEILIAPLLPRVSSVSATKFEPQYLGWNQLPSVDFTAPLGSQIAPQWGLRPTMGTAGLNFFRSLSLNHC